jgi:CheY-like chemotaxis protein
MKHKLNCILVIDDDEATNFFTRMILDDSGCADHIKTLQSGQKALDYLGKSGMGDNADIYPWPDLIFLDINMPAMDGWEFLEQYKKLELKSPIVVIMLTTSLFPEDKLKAERMPEIAGFEHKPLTIGKVTVVLDNFFSNVATH